MIISELQAIYVMWLRQIKRFLRSKSRIIGSFIQPLFFLFLLGAGFRSATFQDLEGDYIHFLAPGVITMAIMFSSMFTGISVLWDKQFGFMQEVLVAPVNRMSIIIGRTLGGASIALIQGILILIISLGLGVPFTSIFGIILTLIFMVTLAFTSVGFGLVVASKMSDFQGFGIIINLIILPLFFLSSAFYPVSTLLDNPNIPYGLANLLYLNPLLYMVDGLRGSFTGANNMFPPLVDLMIVLGVCIFMMLLGSYFFSKSEV